MTTTRYVRESLGDFEYIEHLDGVEWWEAPRPRRWHRCSPQTRARIARDYVERCACGAARMGGSGPWIERNTRRRRT